MIMDKDKPLRERARVRVSGASDTVPPHLNPLPQGEEDPSFNVSSYLNLFLVHSQLNYNQLVKF